MENVEYVGKDIETLNFEESLAELERIVNRLETGEVPLDDAIDEFNKAMKLVKICDEKLKATDRLPYQLIHSHIASTFSDILKYWSGNKFADSPEQVAEYFMILTDEVL